MSDGHDADAPGPQGSGRSPAQRRRRIGHADIVVRPFDARAWQTYRDLRLRALADAPDAFGSTLDAERARPDGHWAERLRTGVDGLSDLPLLALAGNVAVGLVWGRIEPANASIVHVYQMWVDPSHRRLGVGGALIDTLLRWARSRNVTHAVLSVTCGDTAARRLYEKAGFLPVGEPRPLRIGVSLNAQTMELDLISIATTAGSESAE